MTARRGTDLHPWEGALEEGDASGEPLTLPKVMGQMSAEEDRVLELQAMAEQQDGYIPPHGVVVVCKALLAYAALEIRARQAVEFAAVEALQKACGS